MLPSCRCQRRRLGTATPPPAERETCCRVSATTSLCKLDRDGGLCRDLLGVGHGFLHEPLVGDRASNKAHGQCILGIDGTAGEHHVHRGLEPDSTRQRIAETHLGTSPMRTNALVNVARSDASRMSWSMASAKPPPAAAPFTAAISGLSKFLIVSVSLPTPTRSYARSAVLSLAVIRVFVHQHVEPVPGRVAVEVAHVGARAERIAFACRNTTRTASSYGPLPARPGTGEQCPGQAVALLGRLSRQTRTAPCRSTTSSLIAILAAQRELGQLAQR